jgi:hypothetical protein
MAKKLRHAELASSHTMYNLRSSVCVATVATVSAKQASSSEGDPELDGSWVDEEESRIFKDAKWGEPICSTAIASDPSALLKMLAQIRS